MNIAIVEDNLEYAENLKSLIEQYSKDSGRQFSVSHFENGDAFIYENKKTFDIVFMDIEMPHMDGITAGNKLREFDSQAVVIFVSNYSKYAIKGYSVNALDYLTKPVDYVTFKNTMEKAIISYEKKTKKSFIIADATDRYKIELNDIVYVEVIRHRVLYHTTRGDYDVRGSLKDCEQELPESQFIRCNSGCIINLQYARSVSHDSIRVLNYDLPVSRNRKKPVMDALTRFIGE